MHPTHPTTTLTHAPVRPGARQMTLFLHSTAPVPAEPLPPLAAAVADSTAIQGKVVVRGVAAPATAAGATPALTLTPEDATLLRDCYRKACRLPPGNRLLPGQRAISFYLADQHALRATPPGYLGCRSRTSDNVRFPLPGPMIAIYPPPAPVVEPDATHSRFTFLRDGNYQVDYTVAVRTNARGNSLNFNVSALLTSAGDAGYQSCFTNGVSAVIDRLSTVTGSSIVLSNVRKGDVLTIRMNYFAQSFAQGAPQFIVPTIEQGSSLVVTQV